MNELFYIGFTLGVLGSLHCVGMCGPISLALPIGRMNKLKRTLSILIYNAGRIITYSFLGVVLSYFGRFLAPVEFQQNLSIILGVIIICTSIIFLFNIKFNLTNKISFLNVIKKEIIKQFNKTGLKSIFVIGFLNGLLPCGFVYLAVSGALAISNPLDSMLFMAFFGAGTLPAMLLVGLGGSFLLNKYKTKLFKLAPYMLLLIGSLMIIRGMDLGIPYLSPKAVSGNKEIAPCCNPAVSKLN